MSSSKLPHAVSSIVNHLWLVFQPILAALLGLCFTDSSNNNDDDAAAPDRNLPGDNTLPQAVSVAVSPPAPDALAPPAAQVPLVAAPHVASPPGTIEPGRPAIPATLPQMVLFHFDAGTQVSSSLLPPGIS